RFPDEDGEEAGQKNEPIDLWRGFSQMQTHQYRPAGEVRWAGGVPGNGFSGTNDFYAIDLLAPRRSQRKRTTDQPTIDMEEDVTLPEIQSTAQYRISELTYQRATNWFLDGENPAVARFFELVCAPQMLFASETLLTQYAKSWIDEYVRADN